MKKIIFKKINAQIFYYCRIYLNYLKKCYSILGDNMKTDIIYNSDNLLVNIEGDTIINEYNELKRKVDLIISTYKIDNIVFDIKNLNDQNNIIDDLEKKYKNVQFLR